MKMIMNVTLPHHQFNAAVKDGSVGKKLNDILESIKPEAVYFTLHNGKRGVTLILDVAKPSSLPAIAEPWFLDFEADIEIQPFMSPDELKQGGLDALAKKWG